MTSIKKEHKLRFLFNPLYHEGIGFFQCDLCKKVIEVPIDGITKQPRYDLDQFCDDF